MDRAATACRPRRWRSRRGRATLAYVKARSTRRLRGSTTAPARTGGPGGTRASPGRESVAYLREGPGGAQELKLAPAAGGASRALMSGWRESFHLAFSPDSQTIAALRGPEIGKLKLVLIDVAAGPQRVLAQ